MAPPQLTNTRPALDLVNAPALNAPASIQDQASQPPDPVLDAITANLREQLIAAQYDNLPITTDNGISVYLLLPGGSCPRAHLAAAERLVADGCVISHRYIGGSSPALLVSAP